MIEHLLQSYSTSMYTLAKASKGIWTFIRKIQKQYLIERRNVETRIKVILKLL